MELPLSDHMRGLDPSQGRLGRMEGLEAKHRARDPLYEERCCTEGEFVGTRPTRDGFQAVRLKLGRPSSVIRLRTRAPILASVF